MNALRQDPKLEMRGGFYDLKDSKHIYINKNLPSKIRKEVEAHEMFHRTLTCSTIYGQIILTIDYCLSNYNNQISKNDYDELLLTRNSMFHNMYHVQEAGAIARTYAMLPFIHLPQSIIAVNAMQSEFHTRLVPPYDTIAKLYIGFINLLFKDLRRIPSSLIAYTNDAITAAACNSIFFKSNHAVDFTPGKCVYLNESFSPDSRFFSILDELAKPESNKLFFREIRKGLKNVFGIIDIDAPSLHTDIARKMLQDVDGSEHKMINMIDKCLRHCMPNFSVEQEDNESGKHALSMSYQLHNFFMESIPYYEIPKVFIAKKQSEKEKINREFTKTFS